MRSRGRRRLIALLRPSILGFMLAASPYGSTRAQATEPVALELVLAIDVSSSVSAAEYRLQMQGIAVALRHRQVQAAIAALQPDGVAACVLQWSGGRMQRMAVEWAHLRDTNDIERFATAIATAPRQLTGTTVLGGAIRTGLAEIQANDYIGRRRVIDISGDGYGGLSPRRERGRAVANGITINGLAILNEEPALGYYYEQHVIGGPGAFVIQAADFTDIADAMRRKLIRELRAPEIALRSDSVPE